MTSEHEQERTGSDLTLVDLELITQIVSLVAETIALFGVGCSLQVLKQRAELAKGVCLGLCLQTVLLPFVGYLIGNIFDLEPLDALSILATTSAPIASYSCVLTFWAGGDVSLCVLLSALSTTLSIGFIPLWFFLYHSPYWYSELYIIAHPEDITMYLFAIIIPVGLGALLHRFCTKKTMYIPQVCSIAFLIKIVVNSTLFLVYHPEQFLADWHAWIGTFLIPSIGFLIGFISAYSLRLPYKFCVAISLAVGATNGNMVVSLALKSIHDQAILARVLQVPGIYAILTPIQGIVWASLFRHFKYIDDDDPTVFGNEYDSSSLQLSHFNENIDVDNDGYEEEEDEEEEGDDNGD